MEHITGLIAAPITPMNKDYSINYDAIEKLAEYYHSQPLAGIFINGTTGEGMSLTTDERLELADQWIKYARGDFYIMVHVGHTSVEECKKLASHAQEIGVYAIGLMAPCFFKPKTVNDLVDFCSEVAGVASDLPFYYYHIPSLTGNGFEMIDFLKAAADKIPNLAGMKYTFENLMDYRNCINFENNRFDMLFGRDEMLLASLAMGAKGAVGGTYNYTASLHSNIIKFYNGGDLEKARKFQDKSIEIVNILKSTRFSDIVVNKFLMSYFSGIDCGGVRNPLENIDEKGCKYILKELEVFSKSELYLNDSEKQMDVSCY